MSRTTRHAPGAPRAPIARGSATRRPALIALGLTAGATALLSVGLPARHPAPSAAPSGAVASPPHALAPAPADLALPTATATLQDLPTVPYDGTFTFVRVRFNSRSRGFGRGFGRGGGPGWAHDYPDADENLIRILDEITLLEVNTSGTNVIDADDPELHRYPFAYFSEPGEWTPTQAEIDNLTDYLFKGGFIILDDFAGNDEWRRVEEIFQLIAPGHRFEVLETDEPIFNSFFEIETLDLPHPNYGGIPPIFLGLHEDDDATGRLMVIANFNNDIGDYWEYSHLGYHPIDLSNEAYKFGVNYLIYAMTR